MKKNKLRKIGISLMLISGAFTTLGYMTIEDKHEWLFYVGAIIALVGVVLAFMGKSKTKA